MFESRGGADPEMASNKIGKRNTFVRIYDERRTNSSGSQEKIGSHINPLGGPAKGSMEIKGQADLGDSKIQGYKEAMRDLRPKLMDELNRQEIPPQYRDLIKAFYEK
jgi:hypothetical protein